MVVARSITFLFVRGIGRFTHIHHHQLTIICAQNVGSVRPPLEQQHVRSVGLPPPPPKKIVRTWGGKVLLTVRDFECVMMTDDPEASEYYNGICMSYRATHLS